MSGAASLEIELFQLFSEGKAPQDIAIQILNKYEKSEVLSSDEFNGISAFLFKSGQYVSLIEFAIQMWKQNKINFFPIEIFLKAFHYASPEMPPEIIDYCENLIYNNIQKKHLLKIFELNEYSPLYLKAKRQADKEWQDEQVQKLSHWLEKLKEAQSNGDLAQEEALISQMSQAFPQNLSIAQIRQDFLSKKAEDILSYLIHHKPLVKPDSNLDKDTDLTEAIEKMKSHLKNIFHITLPSDLVTDESLLKRLELIRYFSYLSLNLEFFDLALYFLNENTNLNSLKTKTDGSLSTLQQELRWIKSEALLGAKKFLDLCVYVDHLTQTVQLKRDELLNLNYAKALALKELNQKELALQILQQIYQLEPEYRATRELLKEWSGSLK